MTLSLGRDERGAITIHVALALIALLTFSSIVVDYGAMWVSRRQAQNAADAGALAGAISLMHNAGATAEATIAAQTFAGQTAIWGAPTANADILVSPLPFNCPDGVPSCIRVDVMRGMPDRNGAAHTNSLPTYFGRIMNLNSQGVRATATAQVAAGNAVECIKPWVVADKWNDTSGTGSNTGGWDQDDTWNPGTDTYTAPGFKASGTPNDYGTQLVLKEGATGTWSSGWTMQIDLGEHGSSAYRDEIEGCPAWVPTVGLYDPATPCSVKADENAEKGCIGVKTGMAQGPTQQGVGTLVGLDESATWNDATKSVQGGCMVDGTCVDNDGEHVSVSPRIVPIALFDTATYAASGCPGTNCVARVVNLLGFFVEGMCNDVFSTPPSYCGTHPDKAVVGRLMAYPGQIRAASGSAGPATFLKVVRLIR